MLHPLGFRPRGRATIGKRIIVTDTVRPANLHEAVASASGVGPQVSSPGLWKGETAVRGRANPNGACIFLAVSKCWRCRWPTDKRAPHGTKSGAQLAWNLDPWEMLLGVAAPHLPDPKQISPVANPDLGPHREWDSGKHHFSLARVTQYQSSPSIRTGSRTAGSRGMRAVSFSRLLTDVFPHGCTSLPPFPSSL